VDMIINNLQQNSRNAQKIILQTIGDLKEERKCMCGEALKYALLTDKQLIPSETRQALDCIVGKYCV
jgi:5'-methylthioadenosine phosphorylase